MSELRVNAGEELDACEEAADPRVEACLRRLRGQRHSNADEAVAHDVAGTRARIEQLAQAFVELGSTEDEAIALAIQQVEAGQMALPATAAVVRHGPQSAKQATALALVAFVPPWVALNLGLAERIAGRVDAHVTYTLGLLVAPLVAGLFVGIAARRKPVRGVFNAIALLTVPALMLPGLVWGFCYAFLDYASLGSSTGGDWLWRVVINGTGFPYWLGLGCAGAALGGWIRRLFVRGGRR